MCVGLFFKAYSCPRAFQYNQLCVDIYCIRLRFSFYLFILLHLCIIMSLLALYSTININKVTLMDILNGHTIVDLVFHWKCCNV